MTTVEVLRSKLDEAISELALAENKFRVLVAIDDPLNREYFAIGAADRCKKVIDGLTKARGEAS